MTGPEWQKRVMYNQKIKFREKIQESGKKL